MYKYHSLPYQADSSSLFVAFADQRGAVFLDSGKQGRRQGRYDILASRPQQRIWGDNESCIIELSDGKQRQLGKSLLSCLADYVVDLPAGRGVFNSGLIGYISYDYGQQLICPDSDVTLAYPQAMFGYYIWSIVVDHQLQQSWLCYDSSQLSSEALSDILLCLERMADTVQDNLIHLDSIQSDVSEQQYVDAFNKIQAYLFDGDCYQVNYANRFSSSTSDTAWNIYQRLRSRSSAPYGAFLNFPELSILSASPELFLDVDNNSRLVTTKPIKGTVARGGTDAEDIALQQQLLSSEKDKAENLMIVDLLRNDLGKVCKPGSIKVPELFALESFSNVHHLVSTVTGILGDKEDVFSLLKATLPGGSITGAPKKRAMEIIRELEFAPRGLYCGAIGYIDRSGNMQMNIAIRTLVKAGEKLEYWAGGGIVADSDAASELAELRNKASDIYQTIARPD